MSAPILHLSISQKPVFLLNSCLGLFSAAHLREHPLSLSYGVNLPSSLTTLLPLALEFSSYLPVSVCGTGSEDIHRAFLAFVHDDFPTKISVPYDRGNHRPAIRFKSVLVLKYFGGYGISTVCASATRFRLVLASG